VSGEFIKKNSLFFFGLLTSQSYFEVLGTSIRVLIKEAKIYEKSFNLYKRFWLRTHRVVCVCGHHDLHNLIRFKGSKVS